MKDHKKSISAKLLAYVEYYLGSLCVSGAAVYVFRVRRHIRVIMAM